MRALSPLWRWLRRLLIAYLVLSIVHLIVLLVRAALLARLVSGSLSPIESIVYIASGLLISVTWLALIVTFMWCAFLWLKLGYRAMRNLRDADASGLTISPVGTVVWWFVPIAWYWKPLQAVRQIWRASNDAARPDTVSVPRQIGWWWAFWLAGSIITYVTIWDALAAELGWSGSLYVSAPWTSYAITVGSSLISIRLVFLALWFLSRITTTQDTRRQVASFT